MAELDQVVIISACRTAVGKFQGSLSDFTATQLGAIAVREAVKRSGVDPTRVDECIMGNVVSAGLGQNPARQAAIFGGLAPEVSAMTVQGQKTWQIVGEPMVMNRKVEGAAPERVAISEEDVDLVAEKTGATKAAARKALEDADGEPAEAIIRLMSR